MEYLTAPCAAIQLAPTCSYSSEMSFFEYSVIPNVAMKAITAQTKM